MITSNSAGLGDEGGFFAKTQIAIVEAKITAMPFMSAIQRSRIANVDLKTLAGEIRRRNKIQSPRSRTMSSAHVKLRCDDHAPCRWSLAVRAKHALYYSRE